jgi:hypothetical protein
MARRCRGAPFDGTGVEVERSDRHVDDVAEMVRFQICECEIIQSFGRGRGVNRDALTPLDVDILTDVVVPITVDEVLPWEAPSEMIEAAVEGAVPTAPTDMAAAYPGLWKNADAATWALKKLAAGARARNREEIPYKVYSYVGKLLSVPVHAIQYQRAGAKQKFHWAVFNLRHWPFARAWFAARGWAVAIRDYIWPHEFEPMAGAGGLDVVDRLVRILRKARFTLSADVAQHEEYVGTGRPGRYVLSKDPKAMTAYDASPGGIVDAHSALPPELRLRALDLHEAANDKSQ